MGRGAARAARRGGERAKPCAAPPQTRPRSQIPNLIHPTPPHSTPPHPTPPHPTPPPDMKESFYVGDAAGRPAGDGRPEDFAATDK
jgi:hypothetical protein